MYPAEDVAGALDDPDEFCGWHLLGGHGSTLGQDRTVAVPASCTVTSSGLVWRSLGMLRAVRGLIVVSLLLGVVASALPYISAAAFGPMVQVIADAGESGNLSGVWDLRGPLVARENGLLQVAGGCGPVRGAAGDMGRRRWC